MHPDHCPAPTPPPTARDLPDTLTIFLRAGERSALLRALRKRDPDRRLALLKALDLDTTSSSGGGAK